MTIPEPYDDLILKFLQRNITAEEKASLDLWINQSAEHDRVFRQYVSLWEATDIEEPSVDFQTSNEWQRLQNTIKAQPQTVPMSPWRNIYKVAAAITILAVASFVLYRAMRDREIEVIAVDASANVVFPDGSTCVLQKGSIIRYAKSFDRRNVSLTGQAFFDVVRNVSSPFNITTQHASVTVLGTSFNVEANTNDSITSVYVVTGKVRVSESNNARNQLMITAGQFAVLSHETNILTMTSADNENPLAWKDHRLVFRKASLQKVVSALQDYFKVKIKVRNPDLLRCRVTSVFTDPSLEEVMETLQETLHLRVAKQNNGYEVDGNGCY